MAQIKRSAVLFELRFIKLSALFNIYIGASEAPATLQAITHMTRPIATETAESLYRAATRGLPIPPPGR